MAAVVLESPACIYRVKFVLVAVVENEDLAAAVADHLRPAERVAEEPLAELVADLGLDKNISGYLPRVVVDIVAHLLESADRRNDIGLAGAERRAGAADIADRRDSRAPRWYCLGYVEYDSCDLCLHVEAALDLCSTLVEVVAAAGMQARRLDLSKAREVLDSAAAAVVAVGSMRCVVLLRLLRRVCSTAEG